jgi:hypothetical protein
MEEFETIDMDNNLCRFQYKKEDGDTLNPDNVYFKVFSIPADPMRWFSYTFRIVDDHTAKGEMMTNHGYEEFAKKGIPEKIIEIAAAVLKRTIVSSPITPQAGNYLTNASYKAWKRLIAMNENALLNEAEDRFELRYTG